MNTKKVQELIDGKGWNNFWVAKQIEVREGKFSYFMTGRIEPKPDELMRLAQLLGVPVLEIDDIVNRAGA